MNAKLTPQEIRQGDTVWWRGSFGNEGWQEAKVKRIELVRPGEKRKWTPCALGAYNHYRELRFRSGQWALGIWISNQTSGGSYMKIEDYDKFESKTDRPIISKAEMSKAWYQYQITTIDLQLMEQAQLKKKA